MPRKEYTRQLNIHIDGKGEIDDLKAKLRAADAEIDRVNENFEEMKAKAEMLREQLAQLKSDTGVDVLEAKIRRFRNTAERSLDEFRIFLRSVNLNDAFGNNDWKFEDYYDEIKQGSMTANEAIRALKVNMSELFEESYSRSSGIFDAKTVQSFNAALENMSSTISTVLEKLERFEREGVAVAGGGSGGGGGNIAEMFEQIRATAERMGESTNGAIDTVKNLVEAMTAYAGLDTTKLLGVSQAFDNMKGLASNSLSSKTVENIIDLVTRLRKLNELGNTSFRFDSTGIAGLNGVKLSKTLYYLVDILPGIDKVNVENIEKLAKVDWANFAHISDAKLTSANAKNIKELFESLGVNTGTSALDKEGAAVGDVNKLYESHVSALKAAADAEKAKANVSGEVSAALKQESAAANAASEAAEKDAAAAKRHNDAQRSVINTLKNVQSAIHKLENTSGGREQPLYRDLKDLEDMLIKLNDASGKMSAKQIIQELSELKLHQSDAAQAMNLFVGGIQDLERAEKEYASETQSMTKANNDMLASADRSAAELEKLYENMLKLKDGAKISTDDLNELINCLRIMRDPDKSMQERTEALDRFNQVLESTKFAVQELEKTEKAEAQAKKDSAKADNDAAAAEKRRQQLLKQAEGLLQKVTRAQENWSKAQNNPSTRGEYQNLEIYKKALNDMITSLRSGDGDVNKFATDLQKLNASFAHTQSTVTGAGAAVRSYFGAGLQQLSSRMSYTFGFAAIVTKTIAEVKKMISTAVELDTAMNQLQIVTRSSTQDMESYAGSVSQIAKETAQSTKDLIDATTVYARLGYTMDESKTLAKFTAQLQNVGSIEASAAQDAMTAIIKAFHKDVDDVESVMDKLVTVGNNFPISVSQLAEGMNNAGSMLESSGNSLEQSIALLTSANTTVNMCRAA